MRCKNQGTDYDDDNVQWTCTAALPPEFKLGSTDVICEGYDSPNDPYVLKGSCGVEYRLILTDRGEEKYGPRSSSNNFNDNSSSSNLPAALFWMLFVAVVLWMLYAAFVRDNGPHLGGPPRGPRWGGGGGGGGGDGRSSMVTYFECMRLTQISIDDDPPPPYDDPPQPKIRANMNFDATRAFNNWRPGFWTGAAGGAAAGYLAGNRNRGQTPDETNRAANNNHHRNNDPGVGSSTRPASSFSTTRYESTGFGTSSRR